MILKLYSMILKYNMNLKSITDKDNIIVEKVLNHAIIQNAFLIRYAIRDNDNNRSLMVVDNQKYSPRFLITIDSSIDPYNVSIDTAIKSYYNVDLNERKSIMIKYCAWMSKDPPKEKSSDKRKIFKEETFVVFSGFIFGNIFKSGICPVLTKDNIIVTTFKEGKWIHELSKKGDLAYKKLQDKRYHSFDDIDNQIDINLTLLKMSDKDQYKIEYDDIY